VTERVVLAPDPPGVSAIRRLEAALDRTRPAAFAALCLMLVVQIVWTGYQVVTAHPAAADILYPIVFVPAALLLVATRGRFRWVNAVPRSLIGLSFVYNVADRLGLLGPPGTKNVSWGDFQHFITYTAQVNAFAPRAFIPTMAVLATIAEGTLGVAMLLGIRQRLAALGTALLLSVFGSAMVLSGLSQLQYSVYLMAVMSWFLATVRAPSA